MPPDLTWQLEGSAAFAQDWVLDGGGGVLDCLRLIEFSWTTEASTENCSGSVPVVIFDWQLGGHALEFRIFMVESGDFS